MTDEEFDHRKKSDRSSELPELPPPDVPDAVLEAYEQHIDRTLLRENLARTPAERVRLFQQKMAMFYELRRARRGARGIQEQCEQNAAGNTV